MSKVLIGVIACHAHQERVAAQRDSWVQRIPPGVDHRFFFGHGSSIKFHADEVHLDVPDDYYHLVHKVCAMCRWAVEHDYSHLFKCDTDTLVHPDRLIENSDFGKYDYIGLEGFRASRSYAMGGPGYWLSRKAMEIVANAMPVLPPTANRIPEDVYVGKILRGHGIGLRIDSRYFYRGYSSEILTECELTPEEMRGHIFPRKSVSVEQKIANVSGVQFRNPA